MSSAATTLRQDLRQATRPEHASLDQCLSTLDLGKAADYERFLRIQLTALDALADEWASSDSEDFDALRARLASDLTAAPSATPLRPLVAVSSSPAQWGIAYVIRGSRLGSKLLSARVGAGFAKRYFDHQSKTPWPQFLQALEQAGMSFDAADRLQVIDGAKFAFATYAAAAVNR